MIKANKNHVVATVLEPVYKLKILIKLINNNSNKHGEKSMKRTILILSAAILLLTVIHFSISDNGFLNKINASALIIQNQQSDAQLKTSVKSENDLKAEKKNDGKIIPEEKIKNSSNSLGKDD